MTVMQSFDRAAEDLGNSIHLEHVNVAIPEIGRAHRLNSSH